MDKNWTTFLHNNFRLPETVDEAVERLMTVLEDDAKSEIRSMVKDGLIDLHIPWSKLLASCGVVHPDDASGVIIQALWRRLRISSEAYAH